MTRAEARKRNEDSMDLSTLKSAPGARKRTKRVGRGPSSGHGKTCGRGHKGQRSRSGHNFRFAFEGGQMPLQRRLPKRGFFHEDRWPEAGNGGCRSAASTTKIAGPRPS